MGKFGNFIKTDKLRRPLNRVNRPESIIEDIAAVRICFKLQQIGFQLGQVLPDLGQKIFQQ
jgi:hypothetical protein